MNKTDSDCLALTRLCEVLNSETKFNFTLSDLIFFIRHVSIADGCKNACSHCFSNSPNQVTQTSLEGFKKIIREIGYVLAETNKSLPFFHLGASNDPAFVKNYYSYLEAWRKSMPEYQTIKVFTHGWLLFDKNQNDEFMSFVSTLKQYKNIKVVLSFDEFSMLARSDWQLYLENIKNNLCEIVSAVGKSRIRVEAFYTPQRNICNPECSLQYWREQVIVNKKVSFDEMIRKCDVHAGDFQNCSRVTSGVLCVLKNANMSPVDLVDMTRDCESIFSAGRGKKYFKNYPAEYVQKGLDVQEQKVLYSLKDYANKYYGVIINPDGTARLVDYYGFKLGKLLNGGEKVIPYMTTEK